MESVVFRKKFECARCHKPFTIEKHYQLFCSSWCEDMTNAIMQCIEDKKHNKTCKDCGIKFRIPDGTGTQCMACKKWYIKQAYLKVAERTPVKPKAATKKRRRKICYEELIRRSEYNRVFKDSGWTHYIKGRVWDRI